MLMNSMVFPLLILVHVVQQFKMEMPQYAATCQDVDPSYNVCTFWKNHAEEIYHIGLALLPK